MLQILTGKFFGNGKINEKEFDSVLYSNFGWIQPVLTSVGELRPADIGGGGISSYVFRYKMKYEQLENDVLIMPIGDEAVEQFRILACLWFNSYFHSDRYHVEMLCRHKPRHSSDSGVPSRFVDKFFDPRSMKHTHEIDDFIKFIDKTIAMPRKAYRLLISCSGTYLDALEAIDTNHDLAYSMFVYSLEALAQANDNFTPAWSDYPQDTRMQLENTFSKMNPETVEEIQATLLKNPHLKLKKRFVAFIESHLEDSFFIEEAEGRTALPKNTLVRALNNLYNTRSGYVHSLRPIQQQLSLPQWGTKSDIFSWGNEPYFTFSGLARMVRHVLLRFIERQPVLITEEYPKWRLELPNIYEARMAPKYWIARTDNLHSNQAISRFNGFLSHFVSHVSHTPLMLPDIRPLMAEIEKLVPQSSPTDKRAWLSLYWLCNCVIAKSDRRPNWEKFLAKYESETDICSIEVMAGSVIIGSPFQWSIEECEEVFEQYLKQKFKARAINLPISIEVAIMGEFANMWLKNEDVEKYNYWIDRAILDAAGSHHFQTNLRECKEAQAIIKPHILLQYPESILITAPNETEIILKSPKRIWVEENAYFRWIDEGRKHGFHLKHWNEAKDAFEKYQNVETDQ